MILDLIREKFELARTIASEKRRDSASFKNPDKFSMYFFLDIFQE